MYTSSWASVGCFFDPVPLQTKLHLVRRRDLSWLFFLRSPRVVFYYFYLTPALVICIGRSTRTLNSFWRGSDFLCRDVRFITSGVLFTKKCHLIWMSAAREDNRLCTLLIKSSSCVCRMISSLGNCIMYCKKIPWARFMPHCNIKYKLEGR